jgi:hypothetical protein
MIDDLFVPDETIEEYEAALQDLPHGVGKLYGRVLDDLYPSLVDLRDRDSYFSG